MKLFKNLFVNTTAATNNANNNEEENTMNNSINIETLKSHIRALSLSVAKGVTFNGSAYKYEELLEVADSISSDIISNVFAVTNITARLTGIIAIEDAVSGVMDGLGDKPTMEDVKVLFDNISGIFERQLAAAEKYKNVDNITVLKEVCGGKSVFHYAYAGINALYNKVTNTLGKHLPKVELKNQLLINLSSAIHRVGEVLWSGVKLVLKALRMGVSMAAALAIQCGRMLTHIIRSAVEWVKGHIHRTDNEVVEEVDEEALAAAVAEMQNNFANYQAQAEVQWREVRIYQCANKADFERNMLASAHVGEFVSLESMVNVYTYMAQPTESDEVILNACFDHGNNDESWLSNMAYSLSVGDVVVIDGVAYRCAGTGWEAIQG